MRQQKLIEPEPRKVTMDGMNPTKAWIIYFEDSDRDVIVLTDEEAAHKTYERCLNNWNCHLFEMISYNGKKI